MACTYEYLQVTEAVPEGHMILLKVIDPPLKDWLNGERTKVVEKIVPTPPTPRAHDELRVPRATIKRQLHQSVNNSKRT